MYRIIAKKYPNNEIRLRLENQGAGKEFSFEEETEPEAVANEPPLLLDIRPDFETSNQDAPSGFGTLPRKTKFGSNGKNTLLRIGGVFDKLGVQPENFVFLTGTLPGSTTAAMVAISAWSGWLVHRLKAWLNKYQLGQRMDFYVWERQKRGALHLHYCVYVASADIRQRVIERFKSQWVRLLKAVGESAGVDMWGRGDGGTWAGAEEVTQAYAQTVKKSVVAYLAKYCGKSEGKEDSGEYFPSRWWGASRSCSKLLREMTEEVKLESLTRQQGEKYFDEYKRTLDVYSSKSHTYRDKVGPGINVVAYTLASELEAIWRNILPMKRDVQQMTEQKLRQELKQWIHLGLNNPYLAHQFYKTQTGLVPTLASRYAISQQLTLTELGMLADSCAYLCRSQLKENKCPAYVKRKISSLLDSGVRWNECIKVSSVSVRDDSTVRHGVSGTPGQNDSPPEVPEVQLLLAFGDSW